MPITIPASTSTRIGSWRRNAAATAYTTATAPSPTTKASAWIATTPSER